MMMCDDATKRVNASAQRGLSSLKPRLPTTARIFIVSAFLLFACYGFRVTSSEWFAQPPKPTGDGMDYENIAFHLTQGDGYVIDTRNDDWQAPYREREKIYLRNLNQPPRALYTTGRPPLYPTLIAGCYRLVGRNAVGFRCVRILNATFLAFAGALSVCLTYVLLTQFQNRFAPSSNSATNSPFAIWLGCGTTLVMAAAQNTLASYANDFLTEPLALCLMQCLILCVACCQLQAGLKTWLISGAILGLLILCRSIFVAWMPGLIILAYLSVRSGSWISKAILLRVGCFAGVACLVCFPWWLRNCLILESFTPLGTQGGITLLGGYSDVALAREGDWQPGPEQELRAQLAIPPDRLELKTGTKQELVVAEEAKIRLRSWIQDHTQDLPTLVGSRIIKHWNPYYGKSLLWKLTALTGVILAALYLPRTRVWLIGLPLLSTLVVALLYSVGGRFLVPLYGLLFTLSGLCVGIIGTIAADVKNRKNRL